MRDQKCDFCGKFYSHDYVLKRHVKRVHDKNQDRVAENFKCDICEKIYHHFNNIKRHYKFAHDKNGTNKTHKCDICGNQYYWPRDLRKHTNSKHNNKNHPCLECGKTYTTSLQLRYHYKTKHKGFRNFDHVCHICNGKFQSLNNLGQYMKSVHEME